MGQVRAMIGRDVHVDEPLLTAGIDSRGGMELRRTLAAAFGLQLPVTLLYDHQTVSDIVIFVEGQLQQGRAAAQASSDEPLDQQGATYASASQRAVVAPAKPVVSEGPSPLLKVLRPPAVQRPLFLAAPGVANAQVSMTLPPLGCEAGDDFPLPECVLFVQRVPAMERSAHLRAGQGQ